MSDPVREGEARVSTVELFFDLVFVFTITQLTALLVHEPTWRGLARVVLELGVLFWMYGGYAWLTNAVPPRDAGLRVLLLAGMGAFLVCALAVPEAFGDAGLAFGIAYLLVNAVHIGVFLRGNPDAVNVGAVMHLAKFNLVSCGLVLAAGFVEGTVDWVLWTAAFVFQWATPYLTDISGFTIRAAHFVERHGLIVIIALGESVVALGIAAREHPLDLPLVSAALLGLFVVAALWWLYFDGGDEQAERALAAAPARERPRLAIHAFGYAFLPLLGGIVAVAAGIEESIAHPDEPLTTASAWFLGGGAAAYLLALVFIQRTLGTSPANVRLAAAALALATAPLGMELRAEVQLAALAAVLVAALFVERRLGSRG